MAHPVVPVPVPPSPLLPMTEAAPYSEPLLLLPHGELRSHPDRMKSPRMLRSKERWPSCMSFPPQ